MTEEAQESPEITTRRQFVSARRQHAAQRRQNLKRQRFAFALIGLGVLVVAGILLAGYVKIFVLPPRELFVRVDDVRYTRGDMVKFMRVQQKSAEFLGGTYNPSQEAFRTLQLLVENEIIAQVAPSRGISVTDAEVDAELRRRLLPPGSEFLDPDQQEREFQERLSAFLNAVQITKRDNDRIVRQSLLRGKFRLFIGDTVPSRATQRRVYRLTMRPEDEIDIMRTKYNDAIKNVSDPDQLAEAFKGIVREFSIEIPESIRTGGTLGWVPAGIHKDYDHVIFNLKPGQLSESVQDIDTVRKLLFFMVADVEEDKEISTLNQNVLKTRALQDWLNRERDNHEVFAVMSSFVLDWVLEQLATTTTITPTPQPDNPFLRDSNFIGR